MVSSAGALGGGGTIGVLTTEQSRFTRFWMALLTEAMPPETKLIVKMSLSIAEARNEVLKEATGDWVWFMDDDHTFEPLLLRKLLSRNVDIIQPLVLTRYAPFAPVIMGPPTGEGAKHWRYALTSAESTGIKEVHVVGCAGMLIRRRVWEAMEYPYFENSHYAKDSISEDVGFCLKARELGFKVWVDLDNRLGHLNVGEVWPERDPDTGEWYTRLIFGQETIKLPAAKPKKRIIHETGEIVDVE